MENEKKQKKPFCGFCEHTGVVRDPYYKEVGGEPLKPCPQCVLNKCKCGGEVPYYYPENDHIQECYCRPIRNKIAKINATYWSSGIDKKYQWRFIDEFKGVTRETAEAKNIAYDIISNFPKIDKGLYLWGPPGTGKTLLSSIILTELITRHAVSGKYVKISRTFFNRLRSSFNEKSTLFGQSESILEELTSADLLVVDDFGVQRDSEWEQETLYNLVDARYESEKFTIFTSNDNPLEVLASLSEGRVLSRIREMCRIVEMKAPDFREKL